MTQHRHLIGALILLIFIAIAPEAGALCPMCRTALESPEAAGLAGAFNRGILFLLAVPFSALAIIAYLVYREQRSAGAPSANHTPPTV